MTYRVADISNYQVPNNRNFGQWFKALKAKYGVYSVCILLTDGTNFTNPYDSYQAYHAYKEFGNFSAYHFFRGAGKAEADCFLAELKKVGADKNTVVMLDAEVAVSDMTKHVNAFVDTVYNAGYHNIFVYSMESEFNNANSGIQVKKLHHSPKIWVANISQAPHMKHDAWQYTWTGNVEGIKVDLDYDDSGLLAHGVTKPQGPSYWKTGQQFAVTSAGVNVYADSQCKTANGNYYSKGSHFTVDEIVYDGNTPRLHNKDGYITANKAYVNKLN